MDQTSLKTLFNFSKTTVKDSRHASRSPVKCVPLVFSSVAFIDNGSPKEIHKIKLC